MGTVYVGTSGWAYSNWKPGFYPAKLGSSKFLSYYAARLNFVYFKHGESPENVRYAESLLKTERRK